MTSDRVRIRRMSQADLDRAMEIARSLKDAPHWPLAVYEKVLDPQSAPPRIALVAGEAAEPGTIAVAVEGQRRGTGQALFAALVRELRAAGVEELLLEVRASNGAALGFYRALGFSQTGRRQRYYADPVEDALLLALRLG
jgi:ribosomal-protein-alanine N-acetyltransferase